MRVRVLAFARVGEILAGGREVELPEDASIRDLWNALTAERPELLPFAKSTRVGLNGVFVDPAVRLHEGDELALLPPVGGG